MSVYNENIKWIEEAIYSIINQSYQDWELIIIIDNPELENEKKTFLEKMARKEKRIILLYNQKNLGLAQSLNKGIEIAKGKYIARMDADDVAIPERFERELNFIQKENADMVSTNAIYIDENSVELKKGSPIEKNPEKKLIYTNTIIHPSVMMNKSSLAEVGGYRNFRKSQDYDLWLRMLSSGMKIRCLNEYLMKYRIRTSSLSNSCRLEQYYFNLYQKRLYKQRIKNGTDSFSEYNLQKYIKQKHITSWKNIRCLKCMEELEKTKAKMKNKEISFIIHYIKAFIIFPTIAFRAAINMVKKI